jgi:ferredoxin
MKAIISKGNSKLGKIPNSSLVPVKDCVNCESCKKECYALKAWKQYPNVRKAWKNNSDLLRSNPMKWRDNHIEWIKKNKPRFFRFNVAGDVISSEHYQAIKGIARLCPETKFLLFTKAFKFITHLHNKPDNLTVILSLFPKMKAPKRLEALPKAYAFDNDKDYKEKRFQDALECPSNCDTCGICWDLPRTGKDVKFLKH